MARGRMLNRSISESKQFAELIEVAGMEAGVLFPLMIAHADCEGRLHGDPDVLKGKLCPRIGAITSEKIVKILSAAHELGLAIWYEVDGDKFVALPGFERNQVGLRKSKEPESLIKPPASGTCPELIRKPSGTCTPEVKVEREVKVEWKEKENSAAFAACQSVWAYWKSRKPTVHDQPGAADAKLIRKKLREYSSEQLCKAIDGMFNDPWEDRCNNLQLVYAFRDENISKFIEWADHPPQRAGPEMSKTAKNMKRQVEILMNEGQGNAGFGQATIQPTVFGDAKLLPGNSA